MTPGPGERIVGLETEFGCYVNPEFGRPEDAVSLIKDEVFFQLKLGLIDRHARDEVFEPSESGGFLMNGGRFYIDQVGFHLEYATAECRQLSDLITHDRAGQKIILRAIESLGIGEQVDVYNNSIDHFNGHTFGCHENYLVSMGEDFYGIQAPKLFPFLVTRQIFAGVGRVGGHVLFENEFDYRKAAENPVDYIWVSSVYGVASDPTVRFQLSQRTDHILKTVAGRVRFNRAMINPKWEHFYSSGGRQRLHLLFGEANQSEYAYALKVGTTMLVLRLLEDGLLDDEWRIRHPLLVLREISRDETYRWRTKWRDDEPTTAIDIQRAHRDLAERYRGTDAETDWVLDEWTFVLDALERDPLSLADRLDWVAKKQVLDQYIAEAGTDWSDEALHSIDLEYHNINPQRSLAGALNLKRFTDDLRVLDAMTDPPQNTRAKARGAVVERVLKDGRPAMYMFDWSGVALGRNEYLDLSDPFDPVGSR